MERANPANKTDRRNFFRIDDVSILYYRVLSNDEASDQQHSARLSIDKLTLKARFESLSREVKPLTASIEEDSPRLARYLAVIDKKLNMLSEVLLETAVDELDEKPQQVNISAGGLSFISTAPIAPGSMLELRFVLLPTNVGIYSRARVVFCKKSDENDIKKTYRVAVEFVQMDESFRDLISRHVLGLEQAALMSNNEAG